MVEAAGVPDTGQRARWLTDYCDGMLLHQVRPAWKAWFGLDPEVTPELRAQVEATIPKTTDVAG